MELDLANRLREFDGARLRLETADKANGFLFSDFGLIRHEGPGRAAADKPIEDFDLTDEEGFGQETAACFDPESSYMVLQYNHFGPRSSRIQDYLSRFAGVLDGIGEEDPRLAAGEVVSGWILY